MQTLFIFTDILKSLARIESQIENLGQSYAQVEERNEIDEALIAQLTTTPMAVFPRKIRLEALDYLRTVCCCCSSWSERHMLRPSVQHASGQAASDLIIEAPRGRCVPLVSFFLTMEK